MNDNVQALREKAYEAKDVMDNPVLNQALTTAKELVMAEAVLNRTSDARKLELLQLYKAIEMIKPLLQKIINDYQFASGNKRRG